MGKKIKCSHPDSYTSAGGNSKPNLMLNPIRLYLFWRHLSIHVILNFNFCLFPPATAKTWCGGLHLFGSSERNHSPKLIITFKNNCWVWKNDAFLPCVTPNYKLLPSKPLRQTMPDDDEEAQTQVEEAFHVFVGKTTSGIVMILYRLSRKMETLISRQLTDMKSLS